MRKLQFMAVIVLMTIFTGKSFAQTASPAQFFLGKWTITIMGTPDGDVTLNTEFAMKGDTLVGYSAKTDKQDRLDFRNIVAKEKSIFFEFSAQGYDLSLELIKKDDDNLEGKLMDMFDTKAKRKKD
jgi:hypothetical protein